MNVPWNPLQHHSPHTVVHEEITPQGLGVLIGAFYGFGCPKRHPDALLAKTIFEGVLPLYGSDNVVFQARKYILKVGC